MTAPTAYLDALRTELARCTEEGKPADRLAAIKAEITRAQEATPDAPTQDTDPDPVGDSDETPTGDDVAEAAHEPAAAPVKKAPARRRQKG